ncbi:hypothetical protein [Gudongella oleilytica]|uniref:hypothetical protein n=1 Tax=Gudongella oleilytica TaxID=1582259 RepID=UPI002A362781|nr:hypothetical protein [Gudongella oleilytica]MDY0256770.1 hypothetical protein [Gudongella oleilytica]
MSKRLISLLLIISMIIPLVGCGGSSSEPVMKEELLIEGVVNGENLSLGSEGIELRLDPVFISSDVNARISRISNAPPLDEEGEIDLEVYDFSLEGITQVDGVIQLSIPLNLAEGEIPGAAYLNEATGQWEPLAFMYDEAAGSIVILTDHLSKYGVFTSSNKGKRKARLEFLGLYGEGRDEDFLAAVEEYSIGGVPASECYEIGAGAVGDSLQIGADILGNITQSAGYLAYGEDVLSTIGDHVGNIGLLLSVVQIGTNIYQGKIHEAVVASLKTSFTYVMGKVASKLSSSVMSASMAAVAIVDYSINKFGTEAVEGRSEIYREAYALYHSKGNPGFKGSDYWYKTFYPMFSDPKMTEEGLKTEIDRIVVEHCNEFWLPQNEVEVADYMSQARDKFGFSAGGGLNKGLMEEISNERISMLYQDVLPGVFNQIALRINMDNEKKLRDEYKALSDYLNTSIAFNVTDPSKTYAKHQVKFSVLNDKADIANWTGRFKDDGTLNTNFTLYGHLYAGSPNKIEIYSPNADLEKDEPVETIEFKVVPPSVDIVIKKETGRLTKLVSAKTPADAVSNLLVEDEYKSYFAEDMHPLPMEHLLSQQPILIPESNVIDVSLSGSWATDTVSGKNQYAEWSTQYKYDVQNFHLNIPLSVNSDLPVIGTDKTALLLDGKGTYSYTVTITTVTTSNQEVPAIGEKAWTTGSVTRTTTFTSSGDVELYTHSNAIDSSKPVTVLENGIENLETTAVVLNFLNPVNQANVVENHYLKTTWEDKAEKEETSTNEYPIDATSILGNGYQIYFKYPVK